MVFFDAPIADGQTIFPLPFSYTIGANQLQVFLNGQLLAVPDDYVETSVSSITSTDPLLSTDRLIIRKNDDPAIDNGLITSANIINGKISVSFVSVNQQSGLTDLVFEVRDPSNVQVAAGVPLTEYFGTGAYAGRVDVGVSTPGTYFVRVSSVSAIQNNAFKIFDVSAAQAQTGGSAVVQEATRNFGDPFTFRHIAAPSLSDVKITIYDVNEVPLLTDQPMVEIGSSGVYRLVFNPTAAGLYTGIMESPSINSKSVTEVIFVTDDSTGGSVVISNRVGVGRREDC